MNFSNDISKTNFQVGDIITLQAEASNKVIITNFPDSNTPIYPPTGNEISFKISANGLLPHIPPATLPQEILITKTDNTEIVKIGFDVANNKLLVTSTAEQISNPDNRAMILLYLRDGANGNIKYHSIIASNKNAYQFVSDLNEKIFALNDFIEISSYDNGSTSIKISNFPNNGDTHTITFGEYFKITSTQLEKITPQTVPDPLYLPQILNFYVVKLYFNTLNRNIELKVDTYGASINYPKIKLTDISGTIVFEKSSINYTLTFVNEINLLSFDYNQILQLNYNDNDIEKISISNFPTQGQTHIPTTNEEFYKITPTGLVAYTPPITTLSNEIIINKTDDSTFGTISFDMTNKKLLLNGFSEEYSTFGQDYNVLNFRLYSANDSRTKDVTLNSLTNSTNFFNNLNGAIFDINSVLELAYDEKSKNLINITNFPNDNTIHTPTVTREYYKITANGLKPHIPIPDTIQYFKGDGSLSHFFNLDLIKKVVTCSLVNRDKSTDPSSFLVQINNNLSVELDSNEDFIIYTNGGNGKFDYDNSTIECRFTNNYSVVFVNYPNLGDTYKLPNNFNSRILKVTVNGIKN